MEGTVESLGLRSSNIWVWPDRDYDKMIEEYYADPENAPIPMFLHLASGEQFAMSGVHGFTPATNITHG